MIASVTVGDRGYVRASSKVPMSSLFVATNGLFAYWGWTRIKKFKPKTSVFGWFLLITGGYFGAVNLINLTKGITTPDAFVKQ